MLLHVVLRTHIRHDTTDMKTQGLLSLQYDFFASHRVSSLYSFTQKSSPEILSLSSFYLCSNLLLPRAVTNDTLCVSWSRIETSADSQCTKKGAAFSLPLNHWRAKCHQTLLWLSMLWQIFEAKFFRALVHLVVKRSPDDIVLWSLYYRGSTVQ